MYAGVDYEKILRQAEKEADVILWDGGNNDTSFYASDLEIVVVDPHRPGHELAYFPGEVNLRRADVIVINKVDTAEQRDIETVRQNIKLHNPKAAVFEMACRVSVPEPYLVKGQRVLVVEDGPTLTHGEMPYGAGVVAARQCGAAELVDPRPYAVGSIRGTFERYRHLTNLLPAMGYSAIQRHELEETIRRTPCDLVLIATPIDLARVIKLDQAQSARDLRSRRTHQARPGRNACQVRARARASTGRSRKMNGKDFLSIRDFSPSEIQYLLILGRQVKADPTAYQRGTPAPDPGHDLRETFFAHPGNFRCRHPATGRLFLYLSPAEINLGKRESVYDVAKNLERMVQGIMIRTFSHEVVEQMARYASIPVINGLTDYSHPCQAMADYLTIWEAKGNLEGLKIAFLGDGYNVARSLMFAGAQLGAHVWVATPPGYELDAESVQWARERGAETGGTCTVTNDPEEAAAGADVIYTDVWASMGKEAEAEKRRHIFLPYQVDATLFRRAKRDAIFLHCLPAHRGEEVTNDVIDSPRSLVFQQAENRLHAQKAIMLELMKGEFVRLPGLLEMQELVHA